MRAKVFLGMVFYVLVLALNDAGIFSALLAFVLTGAVPGTSVSVPAGVMLAGCTAALLLVLARVTTLSTLHVVTTKRLVSRYLARRTRLPLRRFSEI